MVIVSDNSIFEGLKSEDNETLESCQLIVEFLGWKKYNKKVITLPKIFDSIKQEVKKIENQEADAYVMGFFDGIEIMGMSEDNPDEVEFGSFLDFLAKKSQDFIFFISNNQKLRNKISDMKISSRVFTMTSEQFSFLLKRNKEFNEHVWQKYYDSSA